MLQYIFKFFIFSNLLWFSTFSYAQSDKIIDSLEYQLKIAKLDSDRVKILCDLGIQYYSIFPEKTLDLADKAIKIAKKIDLKEDILPAYYVRGMGLMMLFKNKEGIANANELKTLAVKYNNIDYLAKAHLLLADIYYEISKDKEAIKNYRQALYYFKKTNSTRKMAIVYSRIATVFIKLSNYEDAIKNNLETIKLSRQLKDPLVEGMANAGVGDAYFEMKEYALSKKFYLQSLNILTNINDTPYDPWIADVSHALGNLYAEIDSLDIAHDYYMKSLSIVEKISNKELLPRAYNSIGLLLIKKKQYNKSLYYFNKSIEISRYYKDEFDLGENLKNLGHIYLIQKKFTKAKANLDEALAIALKIKNSQLQLEIYEITSNYYKATLDLKQSIIYLEKYYALKENLFNETKSKQIAGLQIKYDTDQKEKEIRLLNQQNQIQLLTISEQRNATLLFAVILIMLLIIVVILFWLFRSKRNANRSLKNKNEVIDNKNSFLENTQEKLKISLTEKDVLLKEIHHRVKNNLQLVNSLLSIQARDSARRMDVKEFLTKSQDRVQSMALIHETLYMSDNLAKVNFQKYLDKLVNHLLRSFDVDKTAITITIQANSISLDIEKVIPLGLILTELINNALKHAFPEGKGKIEIMLVLDSEGYLKLSVYDNGIGLPENYKNKESSLGIELVNSLAQQLEGIVVVDQSSGTLFSIRFPKEFMNFSI